MTRFLLTEPTMGALCKPLFFAVWIHLLCSPLTAAQQVLREPGATKDSYAYIIVGGGLTGLVVANRLTENPKSEQKIRLRPGNGSHMSC